jgi:hypothetical protein
MTVNVARRSRRRTPVPLPESIAPTPHESLAIGEINQTVFDCPNCARPIAIGVRRCPGCGTHLVLGVPLTKASVFTGLGLAIGVAIGGALGFGLSLNRAATTPAAGVAVLPSQSTTAGGSVGTTPTTVPPTAVPSSASSPTDIPPISRAALSQALGLNGRLGAGAATLKASLAARDFDASSVAETLRALSADSVFGQQLAGRLLDWPGSATLGGDLGSLYDSVHETATKWTVSSVRDEAAYHAAAVEMLDVLKGLTAVDAEAQALADQIGLEVAPAFAP